MSRYDPGIVYNCPAHGLRLYASRYLLVCPHERHASDGTQAQAVICPRCEMASFNPNDLREGYCGNCHDWTQMSDE